MPTVTGDPPCRPVPSTRVGFHTCMTRLNPHPYPLKPVPLSRVQVFESRGMGGPKNTRGLPLPITMHSWQHEKRRITPIISCTLPPYPYMCTCIYCLLSCLISADHMCISTSSLTHSHCHSLCLSSLDLAIKLTTIDLLLQLGRE